MLDNRDDFNIKKKYINNKTKANLRAQYVNLEERMRHYVSSQYSDRTQLRITTKENL